MISPIELSLLIQQHLRHEPDPCRVCGAELEIASMGGGEATKYACPVAAKAIMRPGRDAMDHYGQSKQSIAYHGSSAVVGALRELRSLRAAGEDMTVPVGYVYFPMGHGEDHCWRSMVHRGDDRWDEVIDFHYTHDPSHAKLERG